MNNEIIIRNAIRTPDGTVLRSYHRHDYKEHVDEVSGEIYVVDGGNDYIRRSINDVPAESLDVYLTDPFEDVREAFVWRTYGKNGDQPGMYVKLSIMTDKHIQAILETQTQIHGSFVEKLFKDELKYRKQKGIVNHE